MNLKIGKLNFTKILLFSLGIVLVCLFLADIVYISFANNVGMYKISLLLFGITTLIAITVFVIMIAYFWKQKVTLNEHQSNFQFVINKYLGSQFNSGYMMYDEKEQVIHLSENLSALGLVDFYNKNIKEILNKLTGDLTLKWKGNYFEVINVIEAKALFFRNKTKEENLKDFIKAKEATMILVKYNVISTNELDNLSKIKIRVLLNEYLHNFSIKTNSATFEAIEGENLFTVLTHWNNVKTYFDEKNIFMNEIMDNFKELSKFITISAAVSSGVFSFKELKSNTVNLLKTTQSRGGQQVAVQLPNGKVEYIGSSTSSTTEYMKSDINFFADSLFKKIKKADYIYLTSHIEADIDAFATVVAFASYIYSEITKKVSIILPSKDKYVQRIWNLNIRKETKEWFIEEETALKDINSKSILIVFDVNNEKLIQTKSLFSKLDLENIFLIDHHRTTESSITTMPSNTLIDIGASSTSELVTNIIAHQTNNIHYENFDFESTLLLSGIYLDTKHLTKNTNSSTYKTISTLIENGANISKAKTWNLDKFDEYSSILKTCLDKSENIYENVLFVELPYSKKFDSSEIGKASDSLMEYSDIDAAIIIGKVDKATVKLSMRSNEKLNSQFVCEKLGGGGHFNSSAATFKVETKEQYDKLVKNLKTQIIKLIIKAQNTQGSE